MIGLPLNKLNDKYCNKKDGQDKPDRLVNRRLTRPTIAERKAVLFT